MENPRTTAARDHDDHELIDAAVADQTPSQSNASGHGIATDVASQAELDEVADPDGRTRVRKDDAIDNDQARRSGNTPGS
jgi:hypothetical protein